MRTIFKIIPVIVIIAIVAFISTANVLILATDTSEGGIPGIDMAATWSLDKGFDWIYPGSSFNSHHETLHNIYMINPNDPFQAAVEIMEYTYHIKPNLVVTINNNASQRIFGASLVDNIREYDWQEGYDRAPAIEAATQGLTPDYGGVVTSILTGDIKFHFV